MRAASVSSTPLVRLPAEPDDEALRNIVAKRIARERGLSLPHAYVVAGLAGLGPEDRRTRR